MKKVCRIIPAIILLLNTVQAKAQCDLQVFPSSAAICVGDSVQLVVVDLSGNATGDYNWSPASGISDPGSAVVYANPQLTTTYQVTNSACTAQGDTVSVTVTVNEYPQVNAVPDQTYCNGAAGNEVIFSSTTSGASFIWQSTTGINIGFGTNGTGHIPEFNAFNDSILTVINTIEVTATANGCTGPAESFDITVNPTPLVSSVPPDTFSYCNGNMMSEILFESFTPGSDFQWTSDQDIGFGTAGTGGIPVAQASITGLDSVVANIEVTAMFSGCTGPDTSFKITVYPIPTFTSDTLASVCSGSPFQYTATGTPGAEFKWSRAVVSGISNGAGNAQTNTIQETLINTTSQPITVEYVYTLTPTFAGKKKCKSITTLYVTVYPIPLVNPVSDKNFCSGETVSSISFSSATPGASFSWTSDINIGFGTSGTGPIPAFVANNAGSTTQTATVTVYASANNCPGATPDVFLIAVTPGPVLITAKTGTVCTGSAFAYTAGSSVQNTTFSWTRPSDSFGNNAAGASSAIINEVLNNTSPLPVIVKYAFQLTSGVSCAGTDTLAVTVFPKPVLSSPLNVITCDSVPFVYLATSATPGTSITWVRNPVDGISNGFASGSTNLVNESLNNTTTDTVNVIYNFTLTANGCASNFQDVIAKVSPNPVLNNIVLRDTTCNNTLFEYEATSTISGTTFTWKRDSVAGISNPADSAEGPFISETLLNTTASPVEVVYEYTLTEPNGCPFQQNLVVTVFPTLVLTTDTSLTTCDNSPFVYQALTNTTGVLFSWSRDVVNGISNAAASSANSLINEVLDNATDTSLVVTYSYSLQIGDCIYHQDVEVTVNPTMALSSPPVASICNNELFTYQAASTTPGAYFSWSRLADTIGNAAASADTSLISEIIFNDTPTPKTVTYLFTLTTPDSVCSNVTSVVVTVNPTPVIDPVPDQVYCHNDAIESLAFTSATPDAVFTWTSTADIGFGLAGTGALPFFFATNPDTIPVTTTVEIQVVSGPDNCEGENYSFDVTVNPVPKLISSAGVSICSGNYLNYAITPSYQNNVFYSWITLPVQFVSGNNSKFVADTVNIIPDLLIDSIDNAKILVEYGITLIYSVGANFCISDTTIGVTINPSPPLPLFTSLLPNTDTVTLCHGSENINFNINDNSNAKGLTYYWASEPPGAVDIRNSVNPNTVISFNGPAETVVIKAYAFNSEALGGCPDSTSQVVLITSNSDSINERRIFMKQPGNLLVYPDNSLAIDSGYQWGYDIRLNDSTLGAPDSIPNQVYQVFTPESKFINAGQLDTVNYAFWVLLKDGLCRSKVYYNGPYAPKKLASENQAGTEPTVHAYPNPSSGDFTISIRGNIYGILQMRMYNMMGERVYENSLEKRTGETSLMISEPQWPAGIYLLELSGSDQKTLTSRMIITH